MAKKSEVVVADVLHKCETIRAEMIDIMREMMTYLQDSPIRCLSVGDQLTKERQDASKRHVMCSNTPAGRLEMLEPCIADWHGLMTFPLVSTKKCQKETT